MTEPKKMLTEEQPESPQDYSGRQLTEVGGATQASQPQRILTETLPTDEDEDSQPQTLLG